MILLFLSAILTVFCGQVFFLNFSIQGLNRAIINTPIEMMYNTVKFSGETAYFDKSKFEEYINTYYDYVAKRYCSDYKSEFYYYNIIDGSMCLSNNCQAVEINFSCRLTNHYNYHRIMYYELRD